MEREATFGEVRLTRVSGQHGTGEIGRRMAPVSGFIVEAPDDPLVYIAGDTIWYDEVAEAVATHLPDVIVVNGSGARFLEGDPIVMTAEDIARVHEAAPDALIVVVHLEAINHCLETRADVRVAVPGALVPEDGETLEL